MASLLRQIIRKPSYGRLFATSTYQNPYFLTPPPFLQSPRPGGEINPENGKGLRAGKEPRLHSSSEIYPTFSFGYFLNPNLSSRLGRFEPVNVPEKDGSETDDSGMMWADSVKKKRKKKMNKHKYKKLRKLLRRRT